MIVGRVTKDTAEIARCVVDLEDWLDSGEVIGSLTRFSLVADDTPLATAWQVDYPFDPTTSDAIVDATPLILTGSEIRGDGTQAVALVGAGTPGLSYIVSFVVTGSTSGRQKQIDFYVTVNEMVNDEMISSLNPAQSVTVTSVAGTTALALGTTGSVHITNATAAEITVILPPSPVVGQSLSIMDRGGNAATYTIHLVGDSGALINGSAQYNLTTNYQAVDLEWDGVEWGIA